MSKFYVGQRGTYMFTPLFPSGPGMISKITDKFLFFRKDHSSHTVVFNADGTGTSRGRHPMSLGNGDPYPVGADDGTDQNSWFNPDVPVTDSNNDEALANECREAYATFVHTKKLLKARGYDVDEVETFDGGTNGQVYISKTITL